MDRHETVAKLSTLIRLGETAEQAYGRALPKLDDPAAVRLLARFRAEHRENAEAVRGLLASLGEEQQPRSADFESFADAVLDRVHRARRRQEVLAGARQAEAAVLLQYADAAEARLPLQVGRIIRRHLVRNEDHLDRIDELRGVRAEL